MDKEEEKAEDIQAYKPNPKYEYEDDDIRGLLEDSKDTLLTNWQQQRPHEPLPQIFIAPPLLAHDASYGIHQYLAEIHIQLTLTNTQYLIWVPYNIGLRHWAGVLLAISPAADKQPGICAAYYTDALYHEEILSGRRCIPSEIVNAVQYHHGITVEPHTLWLQRDSTSCGAYLIENIGLISTLFLGLEPNVAEEQSVDKIRQKHIEVLEPKQPGFAERQFKNEPRVAPITEQFGWLQDKESQQPSAEEFEQLIAIVHLLQQDIKEEISIGRRILKLYSNEPLSPTEQTQQLREALEKKFVDVFLHMLN